MDVPLADCAPKAPRVEGVAVTRVKGQAPGRSGVVTGECMVETQAWNNVIDQDLVRDVTAGHEFPGGHKGKHKWLVKICHDPRFSTKYETRCKALRLRMMPGGGEKYLNEVMKLVHWIVYM